jgi:hypothetical protein
MVLRDEPLVTYSYQNERQTEWRDGSVRSRELDQAGTQEDIRVDRYYALLAHLSLQSWRKVREVHAHAFLPFEQGSSRPVEEGIFRIERDEPAYITCVKGVRPSGSDRGSIFGRARNDGSGEEYCSEKRKNCNESAHKGSQRVGGDHEFLGR